MRILANHGADPRFAFLRGRWARAWRLTKGKLRLEQEAEKRKAAEAVERAGSNGGLAMGGLAGYGDSDDDEQGGEGDEQVAEAAEGAKGQAGSPPPEPAQDDDALKAARRARAKEWAERRRAEKAGVAPEANP